jgi:hypothetical protein
MRSPASWRRWAASEMERPPSWTNPFLALIIISGAIAWMNVRSESLPEPKFDGFNVVATPAAPFGSASADLSLAKARQLGASAVAVIPFLWQPRPDSPDLVRGNDMNDEELRVAIREAHAHGLAVLLKPHVWVPQSWAGAIVMHSDADWQLWFASYRRELAHIAKIAQQEKADALAIGTELSQTTQQPQWNELIVKTRAAFSGRLLYVAHNAEEAETVPFWPRLDAIGVSLYPSLGGDNDRDFRQSAMRATADRLDRLSVTYRKPVVIAEIGLRSAEGAAANPWESAEERTAPTDPTLQADVLADWLAILNRTTVDGVLIWRWFTNPQAGGLTDTDFTVQGKPAERVLQCAWTRGCQSRLEPDLKKGSIIR